MTSQPNTDERERCQHVCVIGRVCYEYWWDGVQWCHATPSTVRPIGCPTAERDRLMYNTSLQERRVMVGAGQYNTLCRHREPIEAEMNENDAQTICFDCEDTHQLSCLCFGQNGIPNDCKTYDARREIVEGEPTSRYDIHQELSGCQVELHPALYWELIDGSE